MSDASSGPPKPHVPNVEEKIWAVRFNISEQARREHRDNAALLVKENGILQERMEDTERDTMEVVGFLRTQLSQKEEEMRLVREEAAVARKAALAERDALADDCVAKLAAMEANMDQKTQEAQELLTELTKLREFRQAREQMEHEVAELRRLVVEQEAEAAKSMQRAETRFMEEKARLRRTAEKQITELADQAHEMALDNLGATSRQAFRDNTQLKEALGSHIAEADALRRDIARAQERLAALRQHAEEQKTLAVEAVARADKSSTEARVLRAKVKELELALSALAGEYKSERARLEAAADTAASTARGEGEALRHALDIKSAELRRIKQLARNLLDQRSEVEQFFLESMQQVKGEIASARASYEREVKAAFNASMRSANSGRGSLPSIRTFGKGGHTNSTNSVTDDFAGADSLPPGPIEALDVGSLTWEQRERVLQILFAKMNRGDNAKDKIQQQQQQETSSLRRSGSQTHHQQQRQQPRALPAPMMTTQRLTIVTPSTAGGERGGSNAASTSSFFLTEGGGADFNAPPRLPSINAIGY